MLERNPTLKGYFERRKAIDDKKISAKKDQKANMDRIIRSEMQRKDREFLKQNAARLRATFQKDSRGQNV